MVLLSCTMRNFITLLFVGFLIFNNILGIRGSVLINEINSDDPAKPEKKEFIELIAYGSTQTGAGPMTQLTDFSLRGYKIVVVSAYQRGTKGPTIELVANLWNSRISNGYFVFGGLDVPNSNLKVDNPLVTYRRKFTKTPSLFGFLSNSNVYPHAIFLLYRSDGLPEIKLTEQTPYIKIDDAIKETLRTTLQDIVVYGRRSVAEHCNIFEEICPALINRNYILREFDIPSHLESDYSINRCSLETTPILAEKFKLGTLTPGAVNDCSGSKFLLERDILNIVGSVRRHYRNEIEDELMDVAQCSSRLEPDLYYSIKSQKVDQQIQTEINMQKMNEICTVANGPDDLAASGNNKK